MSVTHYRTADFLRDFDWAAKDFYVRRGRGFENFPHGASGYFHRRAVEVVRSRGLPPPQWVGDDEYFIELLYAVLAAWGMDIRRQRRWRSYPGTYLGRLGRRLPRPLRSYIRLRQRQCLSVGTKAGPWFQSKSLCRT